MNNCISAQVVAERPFCAIRPEVLRQAKELMDSCREVIITLDMEAVGEFGEGLRELCAYAVELGKVRGKVSHPLSCKHDVNSDF